MGKKKAVQIFIQGRVQGVGFRYSARRMAESLGVCGWVKNEYNGTVTALCEGNSPAVDAFVRWCRKGPPSAHVTGVDIKNIPFQGMYRSFSITY